MATEPELDVGNTTRLITNRFLALAKDPRIIPGVHQHCDEWCDYCPLTARCLAFRCTAEFRKLHGRADGEPTFVTMAEAITFTRQLSAIEGLPTDELDALVKGARPGADMQTSDPLASQAWGYAVRAAMLTALVPVTGLGKPNPAGPSPHDVVVWYHLRIYLRVGRALIAKERYAAGRGGRLEDANGSAKLALVSVIRSREALRALDDRFDRGLIDELIQALDDIELGLDEKFPDARRFVRLGLDVQVA